jgi:PAS domain-containing protein
MEHPVQIKSFKKKKIMDIELDAKFLAPTKELKDSLLIQGILDTVPDLVLLFNEKRQIIFANEAICRISKFKKIDHIMGKKLGEALNCEHYDLSKNGCGESKFCKVCGALNALEATELTGTVTLGNRKKDKSIIFWVHIPGKIPKEIQPKIINP